MVIVDVNELTVNFFPDHLAADKQHLESVQVCALFHLEVICSHVWMSGVAYKFLSWDHVHLPAVQFVERYSWLDDRDTPTSSHGSLPASVQHFSHSHEL
jgi:hypothetical protein